MDKVKIPVVRSGLKINDEIIENPKPTGMVIELPKDSFSHASVAVEDNNGMVTITTPLHMPGATCPMKVKFSRQLLESEHSQKIVETYYLRHLEYAFKRYLCDKEAWQTDREIHERARLNARSEEEADAFAWNSGTEVHGDAIGYLKLAKVEGWNPSQALANASRMAACWNACREVGAETSALRAGAIEDAIKCLKDLALSPDLSETLKAQAVAAAAPFKVKGT